MGIRNLLTKIKSWSLVNKIALVTTLIGLGLTVGVALLPYIFPVPSAEPKVSEGIANIDVDVAYEHIQKFLGPPMYQQELDDNQYLRIYAREGLMISLLTKKSDNIIGFSVMAIDNPRFDLQVFNDSKDLFLGEFTFLDFDEKAANPQFDMTSKDAFYFETHYFGKQGQYRTYVVGNYSRAHVFDDQLPPRNANDEIDSKSLPDYRMNVRPNYYAVVSFHADKTEKIIEALYPYHVTVDSIMERVRKSK